jgi:hypothetical protein
MSELLCGDDLVALNAEVLGVLIIVAATTS